MKKIVIKCKRLIRYNNNSPNIIIKVCSIREFKGRLLVDLRHQMGQVLELIILTRLIKMLIRNHSIVKVFVKTPHLIITAELLVKWQKKIKKKMLGLGHIKLRSHHFRDLRLLNQEEYLVLVLNKVGLINNFVHDQQHQVLKAILNQL